MQDLVNVVQATLVFYKPYFMFSKCGHRRSGLARYWFRMFMKSWSCRFIIE